MKRIFSTLLKSAGIGLVCGMFFGFIRGMQIYSDALMKTREMSEGQAASILCSAGSAPMVMAILGAPAGALVGLSVCGLMLLSRAVAGKRRLP
ncbi:MAG TPA: hypothetical protein VEY11_15580 [Pyrinomonadaceae bacterium]|nr:hypothetical protein [Pyrinomonadaceae bacterium]